MGDPGAAPAQAAAFRRWAADPTNCSARPQDQYLRGRSTVEPRLINDDLRAVAELFAFLAANPADTRAVLGESSPCTQAPDAHAAAWLRQVSRLPHKPTLNTEHYIDDRALAQITAVLPLLALPRDEKMLITRGDGTQVLAGGFGDPQAMRMILLQILTGRRESEIRVCEFDCLSALPARPADAEGPDVMRFRYAQSKIDIAPDTILVDRDVTAIITEQQQWVREQHPTIRATVPVHPTHLQHRRRQILLTGHLPSLATPAQRPRPDHRQRGPAGAAEPHPVACGAHRQRCSGVPRRVVRTGTAPRSQCSGAVRWRVTRTSRLIADRHQMFTFYETVIVASSDRQHGGSANNHPAARHVTSIETTS
jgi:hypothetical protein